MSLWMARRRKREGLIDLIPTDVPMAPGRFFYTNASQKLYTICPDIYYVYGIPDNWWKELTGNKWDITINKVEGIPSKFGKDGAHICLPKKWLKTKVVVVPKETWEQLQKRVSGRSRQVLKVASCSGIAE